MGLQGIGGGVEGFTRGRGGGGVGGERDERRQDRVTDWLEPKRDATCLRDWDLCESENARRDGVSELVHDGLLPMLGDCASSPSLSLSVFPLIFYIVISSPREERPRRVETTVLIQDDPAWVLTLEDYLLWEATLEFWLWRIIFFEKRLYCSFHRVFNSLPHRDKIIYDKIILYAYAWISINIFKLCKKDLSEIIYKN